VEGGIVLVELSAMHGQSGANSGRELPEMCLQPNEVPAMTDYPSAAEA